MAFNQATPPNNGVGWASAFNANEYYFYPTGDVAAANGNIGGIIWNDINKNRLIDPNENLLDRIGLHLRYGGSPDILDTTSTDSNGHYEFDNLVQGDYSVDIILPSGQLITIPGGDSDFDPITGSTSVTLSDDTTISGGLYQNTDPVANNDWYQAHIDTAISGNVLANDTDADGQTLTASLVASPLNGSLSFASDGSFTYTPNAGWSGQDSLVYSVSDGHGGISSATATILVANTVPPRGTDDIISTPGVIVADSASGVLANDTNPNNGTLSAILVAGPTSGTLTLNPDGSFDYVPNDGFVGSDSFTYRPSDQDGPGAVTTVNISVTDHPPVAIDDAATATAGYPVNINVLANDTDPDNDTLTVLGVSDGIYGTTTVEANGHGDVHAAGRVVWERCVHGRRGRWLRTAQLFDGDDDGRSRRDHRRTCLDRFQPRRPTGRQRNTHRVGTDSLFARCE